MITSDRFLLYPIVTAKSAIIFGTTKAAKIVSASLVHHKPYVIPGIFPGDELPNILARYLSLTIVVATLTTETRTNFGAAIGTSYFLQTVSVVFAVR